MIRWCVSSGCYRHEMPSLGNRSPYEGIRGGGHAAARPPPQMMQRWGSPCYFFVMSVKTGTPKTSNFTFETFSE